MKKWQKFTVLNAGLFLGVLASIFVVPSDTPVWLWGAISIVVIAAMNYALFRKLKSAAGAQGEQSKGSTLIIAVGFLTFVIDLLYRFVHRSH